MSNTESKGEMSEYPEHEKLAAVRVRSQAIGEFLETMSRRGVVLCTYQESRSELDCAGGRLYQDSGFYPENEPIGKRLADYFGINLVKIDAEKVAMLGNLRRPEAAKGEAV